MTKDEKILKDAERDNIPIFVLTAKDANSIPVIREYLKYCYTSPQGHKEGIIRRINEFEDYQRDNKSKVKYPD